MPMDTSKDEDDSKFGTFDADAPASDIVLKPSTEKPEQIGQSPDPMDESIEDDNGVGQPTPFSSNEGPILPAQPAAEEEEEKQEPPEPEKPKGPLVYQKVGRYSLA